MEQPGTINNPRLHLQIFKKITHTSKDQKHWFWFAATIGALLCPPMFAREQKPWTSICALCDIIKEKTKQATVYYNLKLNK